MKKRLWLLLSVTALTLAGCNSETDPTSELYAKGLEMVQSLDAMAENGEYTSLFVSSDEIGAEVSAMGQQDYSSPQAVYKVSSLQLATEDTQTLSEDLKEELDTKMLLATPSMINSKLGVNTLAATSVVTATDAFLCEDLTERCILVFTYNGNYTPIVSFVPCEDGTVLVNGSLVATKALLDVSSPEAVKNVLVSNGNITDCSVEEITME